jgi:hypothetical protein
VTFEMSPSPTNSTLPRPDRQRYGDTTPGSTNTDPPD